MSRNRTEIETELHALHDEIREDIQSDTWAYDIVAEQDLRKKQARLSALKLELAILGD